MLDASVLVELLLGSSRSESAVEAISDADLHLPHLADVEVASVLRGLARVGTLSSDRAVGALVDLRDFPASRWPSIGLFERMWSLRDTVRAYDATYVALSEALDATLVTADAKLARGVAGVARCPVVTV
ncbi:MAG: type II toxin-antitoxin system VapC family toxin [Microbacterium sp.]|uniref:type II toxin-antitoxin system VapC family toxin n=1 Tax=Microbacterium sp. TaxID=51671 RepID=UPI0039E46191